METQKILLKHRSADTPVGLVKSAYRERQSVVLTTLGEMLEHDIGMLTTVIIGNSSTFVYDGKMITPRGYQRKYTLDRADQPIKLNERLQEKHEPWALHQGVKQGAAEELQAGEAFAEVGARSPLDWAMDAVSALVRQGAVDASFLERETVMAFDELPAILEIAVSPGVGNKKFKPLQMTTILDVIGEAGEIEYTPHHFVLLRVETKQPDEVVAHLQSVGLIVQPIGDVVQVKACDFCNGEKTGGIPQAEALAERLAGLTVPKELKIGYAGCAMACYGSVNEDIALVYRKGKFDLFLGGKAIGRNAHPAQRVAEGIGADEIVEVVEQIVAEYKAKGYPDERFHKFFKRVGVVAGFRHEDHVVAVVADSVCGD